MLIKSLPVGICSINSQQTIKQISKTKQKLNIKSGNFAKQKVLYIYFSDRKLFVMQNRLYISTNCNCLNLGIHTALYPINSIYYLYISRFLMQIKAPKWITREDEKSESLLCVCEQFDKSIEYTYDTRNESIFHLFFYNTFFSFNIFPSGIVSPGMKRNLTRPFCRLFFSRWKSFDISFKMKNVIWGHKNVV